jgi:hypothetical protein
MLLFLSNYNGLRLLAARKKLPERITFAVDQHEKKPSPAEEG